MHSLKGIDKVVNSYAYRMEACPWKFVDEIWMRKIVKGSVAVCWVTHHPDLNKWGWSTLSSGEPSRPQEEDTLELAMFMADLDLMVNGWNLKHTF